MSSVYELQKQLESIVLQISDIKQIPTQSAISDVTNTIAATPDIVYGLATLNAINQTIATVNSTVIQLNLVLKALRTTLIIGQ
jgi:hypothetical protein